jgi:hypothetical protein
VYLVPTYPWVPFELLAMVMVPFAFAWAANGDMWWGQRHRNVPVPPLGVFAVLVGAAVELVGVGDE